MEEITFTDFWDAYGMKRDKIAAERAWKRLGKMSAELGEENEE